MTLKTLYPPIEPNQTGFLDVGSSHKIYWEESGNPKGLPALFLHGGPGSGTSTKHRSFFNPKAYRIILLDQRGAGKSTPHASITDNTTWDLVCDLEKLRNHLNIDKWVVFGGSWGSTLALTYAITHPKQVLSLIVRGIFLLRPKELTWFYQFGAHHIYRDQWEKFLHHIPENERHDLLHAYYKRLTSPDPAIRKQAARAWSAWEAVNLRLCPDPTLFQNFTEDFHADALARIECHYFVNRGFFPTDNWILENIHAIKDIPGTIIQGRYDLVCPFESAWDLHNAWPKAKFVIVPDAGHSASEPGITNALLEATDSFQDI